MIDKYRSNLDIKLFYLKVCRTTKLYARKLIFFKVLKQTWFDYMDPCTISHHHSEDGLTIHAPTRRYSGPYIMYIYSSSMRCKLNYELFFPLPCFTVKKRHDGNS